MTEKEWLRVVQDDARDLREQFETTPLEAGQQIAWSTRGYMSCMNGLSPIHRVLIGENGLPGTYCQEEIPAPVTWLELGPGWIDVLSLCGSCARAHHAHTILEGAA